MPNIDFKEFADLLNSIGVDCLVVGGQAPAAYGHPRYAGDPHPSRPWRILRISVCMKSSTCRCGPPTNSIPELASFALTSTGPLSNGSGIWAMHSCYAVGHRPSLAPGEPVAERDSLGEMVSAGRLRDAIL